MDFPVELLTRLLVTARRAASWLVFDLAEDAKAAALDELDHSCETCERERTLYRAIARELRRKLPTRLRSASRR